MGELTAGIAHEIQNPLEFNVNNSRSLGWVDRRTRPQPPVEHEHPLFGGWGAFLGDLKQNLEKINLHGQRASSIIKRHVGASHAAPSTGERQLTDISQLADDIYASPTDSNKDSSFNADYEVDSRQKLAKNRSSSAGNR
ncbi:MAG: histidine kinase dimerization/phospho-acceptor domain-containing protein [Spirosomataceae bacterium]